jgi:hypothetical protein
MPFTDDVNEPEDEEATVPKGTVPTAWSWQPPTLEDAFRG